MPRRLRKLFVLTVGVVVVGVLLLLSGLFGGLLGGGDGPGPADRTGSSAGGLSGQVLSASGAPAPPGVRITLRGGRRDSIRVTDEGGRFRFDRVPAGVTSVEAKLGPLLARTTEIGKDALELRLPGTCRIAGRVVDGATTEPVRLAVLRCAGQTVQVGPRGAFEFAEVSVPDARPPRIEVSAPTHAPLSFSPPPTGDWEDIYLRMSSR